MSHINKSVGWLRKNMCQIHVLGHGIMRSACAVNDNRDQPYRDQLRTSGGDESHQANKLCDVNDTGLISLRGALEHCTLR